MGTQIRQSLIKIHATALKTNKRIGICLKRQIRELGDMCAKLCGLCKNMNKNRFENLASQGLLKDSNIFSSMVP